MSKGETSNKTIIYRKPSKSRCSQKDQKNAITPKQQYEKMKMVSNVATVPGNFIEFIDRDNFVEQDLPRFTPQSREMY